MIVPNYDKLWTEMVINEKDKTNIETVATKLLIYKERYEEVAKEVGCPWWFIAPIHYRESSISFKRHLHNGDPLTARTVHVPKGRPIDGTPPFTWEFSAIDALKERGINHQSDWSIPMTLLEFERYNGVGYTMYHNMLSPYVFSGTNLYTKGKYASDGKFDANLVDGQMGCAPILKYIIDK